MNFYRFKYFHFSSELRNGGTNNSPMFLLNDPLSISNNEFLKSYFKISVINATIPYSWYSLGDSFNRIYYNKDISLDNYTDYFDIEVGNYNIQELNRILIQKFALDGLTVNITYDRVKNKVNITSATPFKIFWENDSPFRYFGFVKNSVSIVNNSISSSSVCNVSPQSFIALRLKNILQYNTYEFNKSSNILAKIPIDTNTNTLISYTPSILYEIVALIDIINFIELELTDEFGNILDLNNVPWQLSILIEIINEDEINNNFDLEV